MTRFAAILAGGQATRLEPVSRGQPKALARIRGKAFIDWQLERLERAGFNHIHLLLGHLAQRVVEHFSVKSQLKLRITYSIESEPLGTGGAVKNALAHLPEVFWVLNGDTFSTVNFQKMELICGGGNALAVAPDGRDAGVYLLRKSVFENFAVQKFAMQDVLDRIERENLLTRYPLQSGFLDIGTPERLAQAQILIQESGNTSSVLN